MHTWKLPSGWRVHHNSDGSGDVMFAQGSTGAAIPISVIEEWLKERGLRVVPAVPTPEMRKVLCPAVYGTSSEYANIPTFREKIDQDWQWALATVPPLAELLEERDDRS